MQKALEDDSPNLALFIHKDSIFEIDSRQCDIIFYCGQYREPLIEEVVAVPLLPDLEPSKIYRELYRVLEEHFNTHIIGVRRHNKALGRGEIIKIYKGHIDFYNLEDGLLRNMRQIYIVNNSLFEVNERRRQYKETLNKLIEQIESHAVL